MFISLIVFETNAFDMTAPVSRQHPLCPMYYKTAGSN